MSLRPSAVVVSVAAVLLAGRTARAVDDDAPLFHALAALHAFAPHASVEQLVVGGAQAVVPGPQDGHGPAYAFFDGTHWSFEHAGSDVRVPGVEWAVRVKDQWLLGGAGLLGWRTTQGWQAVDLGQIEPRQPLDDGFHHARFRAVAQHGDALWVVGDGGMVLHFDGHTWSRIIDDGQGANFVDVAFHRNRLYVATDTGAVESWDGRWTPVLAGAAVNARARLWTGLPDDICVIGEHGDVDCAAHTLHATFPRPNDNDSLTVCPRAHDVLVSDPRGHVVRFDGGSWSDVTAAGAGVGWQGAIARAHDFVLWGTEDGQNNVHLATFNGTSWSALPLPVGRFDAGPVAAPDGSIWAIANDDVVRFADGHWSLALVHAGWPMGAYPNELGIAADGTVYVVTEQRVSTDGYAHVVWRCDPNGGCEAIRDALHPLLTTRNGGIRHIVAVSRSEAYLDTDRGALRTDGHALTLWNGDVQFGGLSVVHRSGAPTIVRGLTRRGWVDAAGTLTALPPGATQSFASGDGTLWRVATPILLRYSSGVVAGTWRMAAPAIMKPKA